MNPTALLTILEHHRGKDRAITLPELAERMGVSTRNIQSMKRDLADDGILIGSSCIKGSAGYFLPVTAEEVDNTLKNYRNRALSLLRLIRITKGAEEFKRLLGQLSMDLEKA
jgi:hypothetical protein